MEYKYGEVMLIVLNMDIPAQERYRLGRRTSIMCFRGLSESAFSHPVKILNTMGKRI